MSASDFLGRDAEVIAGVEKLRFFPLEVASASGSIVRDPADVA